MVQILPPKTNLGTQLGQALGQGLQSGLQTSLQQQYQRSQLHQALGEIENMTPQQMQNPASLLTGILKATAGIPGAERFVAPVFQTLLQQGQARAAAGAGGGIPSGTRQAQEQIQRPATQQLPGFNIPGREVPIEQQSTSLQPEQVQQAQVGPEKKGVLQVPAEPELQKSGFIDPITADSLIRAEQAAGGSGDLAKTRIQTINNQIATGRKLAQEDRDWLIENQNLERQRERAFQEYAAPKIEAEFGEIAPLEGVRFSQYAKDIDRKAIENGQILTPADLYEKSRSRLNDYLTFKGNLEGTPKKSKARDPLTGEMVEKTVFKGGLDERPYIFNPSSTRYKEEVKKMHNAVTPLVQMGETDEVRRILAGKGYFFDEIEDIINPLTPKELEGFRSVGHAHHKKQTFGKLINQEKYQKQRGEDIDKLYQGLQKSLTPQTSLVLLKRDAEKRGYSDTEFDEALQRMVENGFQLSPQQVRDRPLLNRPSTDFLRKILG